MDMFMLKHCCVLVSRAPALGSQSANFFSTHLFPKSRAVDLSLLRVAQGAVSASGGGGQGARYCVRWPCHGMRLARGGGAEQSAKTSLRSGMFPSTLPVFARGSARRLAQKARVEMRADQRSTYAEVAALLAVAGAARALQRERADRQSSGYVRSLAWRAKRNAAPVVQPLARRGAFSTPRQHLHLL